MSELIDDSGVTVVIAGNHRQFVDWCHRVAKVSPRDRNVVYATLESVRGCRFARVVKYGTWYERNDYDQLVANIRPGLMEGVVIP